MTEKAAAATRRFRLRVPNSVWRLLDSPQVVRLFRPEYPHTAIEIGSRRLVGVSLDRTKQGARLLDSRVVELPAGLVQPSLLRPCLADPAQFASRARETVEGLRGFDGRLSVVLPDRLARITFVELEQVAPTSAETLELVRWKLKRSTPFRVEDARISFQVFPGERRGVRCLVSLIQAPVIDQLEQALRGLGFEVGLFDLSTFNLWNLALGQLGGPGDVLLLNVSEDQATAMVSRGSVPLFVRCKSPVGSDPLSFAELRSEIQPTILYYRDRLGGSGLASAVLRAPAELSKPLAELLGSEYGMRVEQVIAADLKDGRELASERVAELGPALGAALGR